MLRTVNCEAPLLFKLRDLCVCCQYSFDVSDGDSRFTPYASKWDLRIHVEHDGVPASDALSLQFIKSMRLASLQCKEFLEPKVLARPLKSSSALNVQFKYPKLGHARIKRGCSRFEMFSNRIDPSPNHNRPYLKTIDIHLSFKRIDRTTTISLDTMLTLFDYTLASIFNSLIEPLPIVFTDGSRLIDDLAGEVSALKRAFKLLDDTIPLISAERKLSELSEDLSYQIQDYGWNAEAHDFCFPIHTLRKDQLFVMKYETDPIAIAKLICEPTTLYESRSLLSSEPGSDLHLSIEPTSALGRSRGELSDRPYREDEHEDLDF